MRSTMCSFVIASLVLAGCGGSASDDAAPEGAAGGSVRLVAYSTPREAYAKLIDLYTSGSGKGVDFDQSYGASGEQSRAVEAGLRADVVAFSLEPDMARLVEPGIVPANWNAGDHKGMVTDSVVVFVVREGNPDGIRGWNDLVRKGVEVVTPNPFTSGGARWNVMAAYGAQLEQGKTKEQARNYLRDLFRNVSVQDKSARESLTTFAAGKGDVLIAYENEAIFAKRQGQPFEYVVPDETILIENPVAATKDASDAGRAFVDFLFTDEAQKVYGDEGYRPVSKSVLDTFDFPTPPSLFTIADVGGWDNVQSEFFDRETGFMAKVQKEIGQPTE
ncbi:MAG: sulfate/thiosulfate transport system substrate-binding protein [Gaiellaceae bacterium]|jgi:sulfate transport system substrate-binding protein|nr:sulfate/thiosulfate transport system substrate-binding protein [Gaiellaceae bacterium]